MPMIELSPSSVLRAITNAIPDECRGDITVIGSLASETGAGLRALLGSEEDLEQAAWANNAGLLASEPASPEELKFTALRLLQDAIEPFASIR
jgi:hypothetical protein